MSKPTFTCLTPRSKYPVLPMLRDELGANILSGSRTQLLIDTDRGIAKETRVAITPEQIGELIETLDWFGAKLSVKVVSGAGERAGFSDDDYRSNGAEVISIKELSYLRNIDLVHALKEPAEHEKKLPRPFLRIGALHLASRPRGVAALLRDRRFCAIFDGSTTGYCSYLKTGGDRTPIVASMSRIAGSIAGRRLVESRSTALRLGRVVITGGGIAGLAALQELRDEVGELIIVEPLQVIRERLTWLLRTLGFPSFQVLNALQPGILRNAEGIIFAHRSGAKKTETLCTVEDLFNMANRAAVIDVAIDQGGSIEYDLICAQDDCASRKAKIETALSGLDYYAEDNMPREEPRRASMSHGVAALPYITMLLVLSARHGGPERAINSLLKYGFCLENQYNSLYESLSQDLRNGLQLVIRNSGVDILHDDICRNLNLVDWIRSCNGVPDAE